MFLILPFALLFGQSEKVLDEIILQFKKEQLTVGTINSNPKYGPLRTNPSTRKKLNEILKSYPDTFETSMVSENEPGEKLIIYGQITGELKNTVLYMFQTDHNGLYAPEHPKAGHGSHNPRLFCYVRPDEHGDFVIRTIVPSPYPGGSLKHIHYSVLNKKNGSSGEIIFDEPPYAPTERQRRWAHNNRFPIVKKHWDTLQNAYSLKISL